MSFIDDLRAAPKEYQKRQIERQIKILNKFCNSFYKIFKEECLYEAMHSGRSYRTNLSYNIDEILDTDFKYMRNRFVNLLNSKDAYLFQKILNCKLKKDGFIQYLVVKIPYIQYGDKNENNKHKYRYDFLVAVKW